MAEVYPDVYNELLMDFTGGYSVVFRVYDKGVAYRLVTSFPGTIQVKNEEAVWNFPEKYQGYFHRVNGFETSFEEHYLHDAISVLDKGAIASLPLYVDAGVARMVITEADLLDYPGLYLTWNGKSGLQGVLPQVPKTVQRRTKKFQSARKGTLRLLSRNQRNQGLPMEAHGNCSGRQGPAEHNLTLPAGFRKQNRRCLLD
jgi:hypothetical protein